MANLIVFYSRNGENYFGGKIRTIEKGNTYIAAEYIQNATGGADMFQIETVQPYPADYTACTQVAKDELKAGARPKIKKYLDNIEQFDNIFVGYPNWWGTCPMCIFTFLEHYNLQGKNIIPFCTNEGSGMGSSEQDIKRVCKGASVKKGLSIHGSETEKSKDIISDWAKKNI